MTNQSKGASFSAAIQRALYVTDKAARSVYRLLPQVVGLRLLRKIGPTMDLEIPKPDDEREEQ